MANVNLTAPAPDARNKKLAIILLCVVAGMVGLAYAAVPIYQIFFVKLRATVAPRSAQKTQQLALSIAKWACVSQQALTQRCRLK